MNYLKAQYIENMKTDQYYRIQKKDNNLIRSATT